MDGFRDGEDRRRPTPPEPRPDAGSASADRLEEVGDLHFHAAAYRSAVDYYRSALRALTKDRNDAGVRSLELHVKLSDCCRLQGLFDEAAHELEAARAAAPAGAAVDLAALDVRLARVRQAQGRFDASIDLASKAFQVLSLTDRHQDVGAALMALGVANACTGRVVKAREFFEDALSTYRRIGDAVSQAHALNNLALLAKRACRWTRALQLYERAAELFAKHGAAYESDVLLLNIAVLHRKTGRRTEARATAERGLQRARSRGDQADLTRLLLLMGQIDIDDERLAAAERHLLEAKVLAERQEMVRELALADEFLGDLMRAAGRPGEAAANYDLALERARSISVDNDIVTEVLRRQAELAVESEDPTAALDLVEAGLAAAESAGEEFERGHLHRVRARAFERSGDPVAAAVAYREAVEVFRQQRSAHETCATLLALAELHLACGGSEAALRAREHVREALHLEDIEGSLDSESLYSALIRSEIALGHHDEAMIALFELERRVDGHDREAAMRVRRLRQEIEGRMAEDAVRAGSVWRDLQDRSDRMLDLEVEADGSAAALEDLLVDTVEGLEGARGLLAVRSARGRVDILARSGLTKAVARELAARALDLVGNNGDSASPRVWTDATHDDDWYGVGADGRGPLRAAVVFGLGDRGAGIEAVLYVDRDVDTEVEAAFGAEALAVASNAAERLRELFVQRGGVTTGPTTLPLDGRVGRVVSQSPKLAEVLDLCAKVAPSPYTVLLTGETGTGKGLLARVIHDASGRHDRPLVLVNCAAIPESLLESELFGHVRGAFTGADRDKEGLIRSADRGTLFLDEIGKMPLPMQAKLLHFLDDRHVRPVGGRQSQVVDVRVICATKRDLRAMVESGEFLEDLFYRLMDFPIDVPPLRARGDDVILLAQHFLERSAAELGRPVARLTRGAATRLRAHDWPGNVRELEKVIRRAVVLAGDEEYVRECHLPVDVRESTTEVEDLREESWDVPLREQIADLERRVIAASLAAANWNRSQVARQLQISYPTLLQKIRAYRLSPD